MPRPFEAEPSKNQLYRAVIDRFAGHFVDPLQKNQLTPFRRAVRAVPQLYQELTDDSIVRTANLYQLFVRENQTMADNSANNQLLAAAALKAGVSGELPLWRFVCLPRTQFSTDGEIFARWHVDLGRRVYDTLTPTLARDEAVLQAVGNLDIRPDMHYVVNDLEAPLSRIQLKPPAKSFFSLTRGEQERGVSELSTVRGITRSWITDTVGDRFPFQVHFVSDMVGNFDEFADLVEAQTLITDPDAGLVRADAEFVGKINRDFTTNEQLLVATRRVAQYGVEGSLVPEYLPEGAVFLDSEPPVQVVWQKITSVNPSVATLFYVTDGDIKRSKEKSFQQTIGADERT